jgi:hypothetical protein
MKRSDFCTAVGLSSLPPSSRPLADCPGRNPSRPPRPRTLDVLPLQAPIPLRPRSDFGRHVPWRGLPRRLATRRCAQLPTLTRRLTSHHGSMPDIARMTEGHHLRRREASLVSPLRSTGPACLSRALWCAMQRGPCHSWRRSDRLSPIGHLRLTEPAVKHSLKPFLVAILVALELSSHSPAIPRPHSSIVPPHPSLAVQHAPTLLHPAAL